MVKTSESKVTIRPAIVILSNIVSRRIYHVRQIEHVRN